MQPKLWQQRLEQIRTAAYHRAAHRNFELSHEPQDWLAAECQVASIWHSAAYHRAAHRNFELSHEPQDWLAAECQIDATWSPEPEAWIEGVEEVDRKSVV